MACDDHELDLSLNQLVEVPVQQIADAHKAIHLDLSCNLIESLPSNFATLTHLVKIDLSKNKLIELPSNFGDLLNLQNLDLYDNQLVSLPVSFCNLKSLKWLDVKNNPLDETLRHVAGDCLDDKECQMCAKKVVAFMQSIDSALEKDKEQKIKAAKEKRELEFAECERKLQEVSQKKKEAKEKKKEEALIRKEKSDSDKFEEEIVYNTKELFDSLDGGPLGTYSPPLSFARKILYFFGALAIIAFAWFYFIRVDLTEEEILWLEETRVTVVNNVKKGFAAILSEYPTVKEYLLQLVHGWMSFLSYYTSEIERIFGTFWQYFYEILFNQ